MTDQAPGRQHQRTAVLSVREQLGLGAAGLLLLCLFAWHAALALTTVIPWSGLGITMRALLRMDPIGGLPERYAPVHPVVTVVLFVVLVGGVIAAGYAVTGRARTRKAGKTGEGMASRQDSRRHAGETYARTKAEHSRRSSVQAGTLDVHRAPITEIGLPIGTTGGGQPVVLSLEDQVGVIAPSGQGKTVHIAVGACLDAPGPLIATSTKPELLDMIGTARGRTGTVWVFDPLDIASWPEPMVWDPVAGAEDSVKATARGQAFAAGLEGNDNGPAGRFFDTAAAAVMSYLLHAAALRPQRGTMATVADWALSLDGLDEPVEILTQDPRAELLWWRSLQAVVSGENDTLASLKMTMQQKVGPIMSRLVMRQLTPRPGVPVFDPDGFVQSTDTLILLTDNQLASNVAALSTMLLSECVDAAKRAAAMTLHGRLDPPLRVVADEVAGVAPLPKLPGLLSDSRGVGIQWVCIFQSLGQINRVWGDDAAEQILSSLNATLVLGGLLDVKALERFSDLAGTAELTQVSSTLDAQHTAAGHNITVTERRVLRPEEIQRLDFGTALLFLRSAPPMIIDLIHYAHRGDGAQIEADKITTARYRRANPRPGT